MAVIVEGLVVPFVFPGLMEGPVLVEVMTGPQGAEPQDRLGPFQRPFWAHAS